MAGMTTVKEFDVLDELIGQALDRFAARPGDMRRQDEVGQLKELQKDMVARRRFAGNYVEPGAGDASRTQRAGQRFLID